MAQRLLIVDDNPGFRRLASLLLHGDGFHVVGTATEAAEALTATAELAPDVVLLDVHLPDGSGFDVAARLAARRPAPALVLTSTRGGHEFEQLAHRSGARGFLVKDDLSAAALDRVLRCSGRAARDPG